MITSPESIEIRERARRKTEEIAAQMRGAVLATQFWYDKLSPEDRKHLGGDLEKAHSQFGLVGMWQKLQGCSRAAAVLGVALKFSMLTTAEVDEILDHLGEIPRDPDLSLQHAVDAGDLVIRDDEERMLFWDGEPLKTPLVESDTLWDFFIEMARRSKCGTSLDAICYPKKETGYVRKTASRIRRKMDLPEDLVAHIVAGNRHDQKIDLLPERIRIFESDGRWGIREWMP